MKSGISEINYLDLFAGGGGLSEGFIRAGYSPVAHIEKDTASSYTLKTRMSYHWLKNHGEEDIYNKYIAGELERNSLYRYVPDSILNTVINKEINNSNLQSIFEHTDYLLNGRKLDLIIGGPPCQAYSLVGRSRDVRKMLGDSRNYLYKYYAEFLRYYRPACFIFENVTGLLSARDEDGTLYFDNMIKLFHETGYETEYKILSAEKYGVPQTRRRVFIFGYQQGLNMSYPEPSEKNLENTVSELFSDLPYVSAGNGKYYASAYCSAGTKYLYDSRIRCDSIPLTFHVARQNSENDREIYKIAVKKWTEGEERLNYNDLPEHLKTHKNRASFTDRFKVVAGNYKYSHTVVAHISKDGHYYIHPDLNQNRSLTPREAARLQTFPDDYFFESYSGKPVKTPAYTQIGNAVPVLLAHGIAEKLKENWS
ncbi:MAG: DNA cytosine methyltransferase [Flexistipes sinusarabici]|uniref:Cytosine-specific methyltransferase n=1 Tax=Flexistipes sinusarabici TaxID=2352 RepID=A0A5D0MIF4_FLESI|nr:DNA cytosine methyltransferase [Flexistipes sinusarabici]TYB32766.1 MAG: DNA cytosine methyltransferase [Flexistipes sinusarabici]